MDNAWHNMGKANMERGGGFDGPEGASVSG
jgi:hypothetical protein